MSQTAPRSGRSPDRQRRPPRHRPSANRPFARQRRRKRGAWRPKRVQVLSWTWPPFLPPELAPGDVRRIGAVAVIAGLLARVAGDVAAARPVGLIPAAAAGARRSVIIDNDLRRMRGSANGRTD